MKLRYVLVAACALALVASSAAMAGTQVPTRPSRTQTSRVTLPPHWQLWQCLHRGEAGSWFDRDSGGNGHYGGLQMHYAWGYGVTTYAYLLSPLDQMWAAERGYTASHHSHWWLTGQWGQTIGPCWQYA